MFKCLTELLNYAFEKRLIISGIVYLGLPSLFMKLDYCLSNPGVRRKKCNRGFKGTAVACILKI